MGDNLFPFFEIIVYKTRRRLCHQSKLIDSGSKLRDLSKDFNKKKAFTKVINAVFFMHHFLWRKSYLFSFLLIWILWIEVYLDGCSNMCPWVTRSLLFMGCGLPISDIEHPRHTSNMFWFCLEIQRIKSMSRILFSCWAHNSLLHIMPHIVIFFLYCNANSVIWILHFFLVRLQSYQRTMSCEWYFYVDKWFPPISKWLKIPFQEHQVHCLAYGPGSYAWKSAPATKIYLSSSKNGIITKNLGCCHYVCVVRTRIILL